MQRYIKDNKDLIDAITINKVNVADIIDDLLTNASNKPLSAAQGVALKTLIDESLFSNHFGTTAGTICQGNDSRLSDKRTPTSHASSTTTYGISTASNYGHSKATTTVPKANGTADVGSQTAQFARGDHVHPHDYPIGFPFVSNDSTSPTDRGIAGTWEALPEGHTIIGAGRTYTVDSTGGADTVTLTTNQIPSHSHQQNVMPKTTGWATRQLQYSGTSTAYTGVLLNAASEKQSYTGNYGPVPTELTGGGGSHENMPPYIAKYVWIRIA